MHSGYKHTCRGRGGVGGVCRIQLTLSLSLLHDTRPNITEIRDMVALRLGWGTEPGGRQLPPSSQLRK